MTPPAPGDEVATAGTLIVKGAAVRLDGVVWSSPFFDMAIIQLPSGVLVAVPVPDLKPVPPREKVLAEAGLPPASAYARPRLRACVEAWPECETMGYDPRCCRFPKSCSATVYDDGIDPAHLEDWRPPER